MSTKSWDGTTNDWFANNGADWGPAGDPAATDQVLLNTGEAYLNSGDPGFTVASMSNSSILAIADPGVTQSATGNIANGGGFYVDIGGGQGGSTATIGGALTNRNTLVIGRNSNANLSAPTTAGSTSITAAARAAAR